MTRTRKTIRAAAKTSSIIAITAPVKISAASADGDKKGPRRFDVVAYTGGILKGALRNGDRREDVVIDLSAMKNGNSIVANLDHDRTRRVGHVDAITNDHKQLILGGAASAKTPARDEVLGSADEGFPWQASIEADPTKLVQIAANKSIKVNGQTLEGPFYLAATSTLHGFAFLSHGADDNTTVNIAAAAASTKGTDMDAALKTFIEGMLPGVDIDALTPEALTNLAANFKGQNGKPPTKLKLEDGIEAKKTEAERIQSITDLALSACDRRPYDIEAIKGLAEQGIEGKWSVEKFRLELLEAAMPLAHTVFSPRPDARMNGRVIEAAICMTGNLGDLEKKGFDDQTLQAAHDKFRNGIGLKQLFLIGAEANGYRSNYASDITIEVQRAAFGMTNRREIRADGFSTISIPNVISNVANKFLREGWMSVDQTALRIAAIRSVKDFKQITTVSLTGALQFEKVGKAGEIKHGTIGDLTYNNQADTYAALLAITRQDMINDDLSVLTSVPRRLGRGGMLKLNDLFWTIFLNNSAFFAAGNNNVSTGAGSALGTADAAAINAAEQKCLVQTDPDGKPVAIMPAIMLVPPTLKNTALRWMGSQIFNPSGTTGLGATNIFAGRYRVESSPYMENSSYTGNSNAAWYLLADPNDIPVVEIAALNGKVEPTVETAIAEFDVLGVQMRGYNDVGVALQEFRGGVRSAGS